MSQLLFDMSLKPTPAMTGTAEISDDGVYRWWLTRELGGVRALVSCGINPSTATATDPDNTIDKEIKFARAWGCGRLVKVNTEDFRTKDRSILKNARKSGIVTCSEHNDAAILRAVEACLATIATGAGIFLAAWGSDEYTDPARVKRVLDLVAGRVPIMCIKTNKDGSPVHPLYQPDASTYRRWEPNV